MATTTRGYNFSTTETVTAAKLHALVDSATITGIVDTDVAAGAAIASTKIAQDLSGYATIDTTQTITGDKTYTGTTVFNPTLPDSNLSQITTASKVAVSAITGTIPVNQGGTGAVTAQAAIDALTAVSAATAEHVLTKDTATGNAIFKAVSAGVTPTVYASSSAGTLLASLDTERTFTATGTRDVYATVKTIIVYGLGTLYVTYDYKAFGDDASKARIYLDTTATGTEKAGSGSYQTFGQVITLTTPINYINLKAKVTGGSGSDGMYLKNFRVYYNTKSDVIFDSDVSA